MGDLEFGIVIETVSFSVSSTIRNSSNSYGCFYYSLLEELMVIFCEKVFFSSTFPLACMFPFQLSVASITFFYIFHFFLLGHLEYPLHPEL